MLGADTGVDPAMTSEVLRTLEDRALLTRVPHPEDGRARAIRVTAAGRRAAQRAVQAVERVDADYFGAPSEALRALRRRLDADVRSPARDASIERERAFHGETAASESLRYASMNSRYGRVLMAASTQGVCFAQFGENEAALLRALHDSFPDAVLNAAPEGDMLHDWLQSYASYLAGASQRPAFPLALPGTPLQQAVWAYLQSLPRGATVTYTDVARGVGRPSAGPIGWRCSCRVIASCAPMAGSVATGGDLIESGPCSRRRARRWRPERVVFAAHEVTASRLFSDRWRARRACARWRRDRGRSYARRSCWP
jgi:O6-methylguanine-DNA--protein-cysteine methyltransferase